MVKNKCLKLITLLFAFFVGFTALMPSVSASAETVSTVNFEETNVLDDLRSATSFNILKYPAYESDETEMYLMNVVEYCYSFDPALQENYGLYLYMYNPNQKNISTKDGDNKVQMAVGYNADGSPNNYEKFDLKFCSKSEETFYEGIFYKFKVIDHVSSDGKSLRTRVKSSERRYDISGIEILEKGSSLPREFGIGGTYKFTGYAKGYGVIPTENTLTCSVTELETVELDVRHTFYRTKTSIKGAGYQNQLDTVYFSVPNRFFETYGRLQRIKAEWYEYKTKDIVVTSSSKFYDKAQPYIGVPTGTIGQYGMAPYNKSIGISLGQNAGDYGGGMNGAVWGWNLGEGYLHPACQTLYYLFKVDDIDEYDPYAEVTSIGGVESNALYRYILNYNKTYDSGKLSVSGKNISADLFAVDIDDYRKLDTEYGKIQQGYSYYDFDADVDLQKLTSWQEGNPSFWDNWITWGLWNAMTGNIPSETSKTVSPIVTLKASDLQGTDSEISDNLLVNANDVSKLKSYYNTATSNDETVVLFRFATSDYYSAAVDIVEIGEGFLWSDKMTSGQAYRAWESVFLNFDIIQLTFNREGVYTVIPVVSNPIDIVNDITPPVQMPDEVDWWKIILFIILAVLLFIILWVTGLLPFVLKAIVWVITLPFRLIWWLLKAIFKKRKPKEKNKEK